MYADRVSSGSSKRPVKDRLNNNEDDDHFPSTRQTKTSKRQRQDDDKWKHDLYDDDEAPQVSNPRVGITDLRMKLQKKGHDQVHRGGKGPSARGSQDLREKLSGSMHAKPVNEDRLQTKEIVEVSKLVKKNLPVEVPRPKTRKPTNPPPTKKSQQKVEPSVDSLLQSLGLEKYSITFQVEEVDMTALTHMNEEDLKALGIPMGPRKKILLALDSRA